MDEDGDLYAVLNLVFFFPNILFAAHSLMFSFQTECMKILEMQFICFIYLTIFCVNLLQILLLAITLAHKY